MHTHENLVKNNHQMLLGLSYLASIILSLIGKQKKLNIMMPVSIILIGKNCWNI